MLYSQELSLIHLTISLRNVHPTLNTLSTDIFDLNSFVGLDYHGSCYQSCLPTCCLTTRLSVCLHHHDHRGVHERKACQSLQWTSMKYFDKLSHHRQNGRAQNHSLLQIALQYLWRRHFVGLLGISSSRTPLNWLTETEVVASPLFLRGRGRNTKKRLK